LIRKVLRRVGFSLFAWVDVCRSLRGVGCFLRGVGLRLLLVGKTLR
jgi:hypothetical protein